MKEAVDLENFMTTKKGQLKPLFVFQVNGKFIVAAYQGSLSKYDILVKYRQNNQGKWSRVRTPKHIHWAVDVLIKLHLDREQTKKFLDFLIDVWNKTTPIKDDQKRQQLLSVESLLGTCQKEITEYESLGKNGEYSVKFLILLAKLLMLQEKTNLETAYMFKKLLDALKVGEDIFRIVSTASHTGK